MQCNFRSLSSAVSAAGFLLFASAAMAQVTPAAGVTPPDDTPTFKIGSTIFADYTYNESPTTTDSDGNTINNSSFNVGRAYVNVTGNLNHRIAYRITPDITRETGSGSSLSGSYTFRLKYAFGQFNFDDWTTKGSWARLGLQQTPYIDFAESVYRYRFQGPIFVDRSGFLTSSDNGLSAHWNFPGNYGDVHAGFYNGEGYSKAEVNNEKAFQLRATVRPMPMGGAYLKGLRLTAFVDEDRPVEGAKRQRYVGAITWEHPWANAGFELVRAKDNTSSTKPVTDANGYSLWVTPRFGTTGWEMLLRHDDLEPNKDLTPKQKRDIVGLAYWFPNLNKVTAALMADYDSLKQENYVPGRKDDTRYGLKMLINF